MPSVDVVWLAPVDVANLALAPVINLLRPGVTGNKCVSPLLSGGGAHKV